MEVLVQMTGMAQAVAAVMEVFVTDDSWQWQTSGRQKSINTLTFISYGFNIICY